MTIDDSEQGRRQGREGPGRRPSFFFLVIPLVLLLGGCGLSLFSGGQASEGAHAVAFARPDCATFVARTLGHGFTLATARDAGYVPAPGDVFDGPIREGRSIFRLFPPGDQATRRSGRNVALDVLALDLGLAAARARLDAACGPVP